MNQYEKARNKYNPNKINKPIKVLFIAESPPSFRGESKRSYFYFKDNPGSDILFATLVKARYNNNYRKNEEDKEKLLNKLRDDGFFLMDAVEYPINRDNKWRRVSERDREKVIRNEIPNLLNRLKNMNIDTKTKIILIKNSVYRILYSVLKEHSHSVINTHEIGFPRYYRDRKVVREIRKALKIDV